MIDFKDPRFQLVIEEDVEAENLEAHRVLGVVRLAGAISVSKLRLDRANSLDDRLLNVVEDAGGIVAHLFDILHGKRQTALVAQVVLFAALVLNVVARRLVDRIVRQVHVEVVEVVLIGGTVLTSRQATEPLIVEKNSKRVHAREEHVNAQIKLELVDQEWLVEIPLHHVVLIRIEVLEVARQEDATALCSRFWLRYESLAANLPSLLSLIAELLLKFAKFCWQEPGLREKLVVLWVQLLHALQVASQMVFARKCVHTRKVIDTLIWFHSVQFVNLDAAVGPENVPLVIWVLVVGHVRRA